MQTFVGGHAMLHAGYAPQPSAAGQTQPWAAGRNTQWPPSGQGPPQLVPPLWMHGVVPTGTQPQSKPPNTHISPAGHVPSQAGARVSLHGVAPGTQAQAPLGAWYAHTGASAGQEP